MYFKLSMGGLLGVSLDLKNFLGQQVVVFWFAVYSIVQLQLLMTINDKFLIW